MSTDQLQTPIRNWTTCLTVGGLDRRIYDRAAPPTTTIDQAGSLVYTDVPMLKSVSGIRESYKIEGGLAETGALTVQLGSAGRMARDANDPGVIFGRLTSKSAFWTAKVLTDMDRTSTANIEVSADPSVLSFPCLLHIDAETIYVTGYTTGPYMLTVSGRGVARTPKQYHSVDLDNDDVPEVTSEVVHWRTRWCTIHVAPIYVNGKVGDWSELYHGFIDSTPYTAPGGTGVTIRVAPLTALLDTPVTAELGAGTETHLLQGYHHFAYPEACRLEHMQWIKHGERNFQLAATSALITLYDVNAAVDSWENTMDFTRLTSIGHPRIGAFGVAGAGSNMFEVNNVTAGSPGYWTAPGVGGGRQPEPYYSADRKELFRYDLAGPSVGDEETLEWPSEAFSKVNLAGSGWTPLTGVGGVTGSWKQVKLGAEYTTITDNTGTSFNIYTVFRLGPNMDMTTPFSTETDSRPVYWHGDYAQRSAPSDEYDGLFYPIRFPGGDDPKRRVVNCSESQVRVPTEVALAFYQKYERYILVEDNIAVPSGGYVPMKVLQVDEEGIEHRIGAVRITASTPVTHGGVTVGYKLTLDPESVGDVGSFGDWTGQERIKLVVMFSAFRLRSGQLMLQLLESGGGSNVNGNFDKQPVGANLPGSSASPSYSGVWGPLRVVNEDSFTRIQGPPIVEDWKLDGVSTDDLSIRDIIDTVARSTSSTVVMRRTSDGRCMLTRVSVAPEGVFESAGTIGDGDWVADTTPLSDVDDRVMSNHQYLLNHDHEGTVGITVNIADKRAMRTHGEATTYTLDLRGVRQPSYGIAQIMLRAIYSNISRLLGDERRVWEGQISTSKALLMQIGSVYTITSRHLKGYGDEWGVVGKSARLVSLDMNLEAEGATVRFVSYDTNATGWNAAMRVSFVLNSTTVAVSSNVFTEVRNPHTNAIQSDSDFFGAGDVVKASSPYDMDASTTLTLLSVTSTVVAFTAAHGLATGDIIEPPTYASQSDVHKGLASIANSSGLLGGATLGDEVV